MLGFDRKNSEALDLNMDIPNEVDAEENKANGIGRTCSDCQTTKTPLWRGGPKGPKSLCNACGIRYRKKRRALLGLNKGGDEKKGKRDSKLGVSFKFELFELGRDGFLQRSLSQKQRKLCEEEEAAVLLMALSCDFVHSC